ncbi:hypothetical protein AgCh_020255 [Apium graveolens]
MLLNSKVSRILPRIAEYAKTGRNVVVRARGQFNHEESSKQASEKKKAVPNSVKCRKQSKKTNIEEVAQGSGSWVNPKSNVEELYVIKTREELTGKIAYSRYKKEYEKMEDAKHASLSSCRSRERELIMFFLSLLCIIVQSLYCSFIQLY